MRHFKFASTWPKPDVNPLKIVRKKSKLLKSNDRRHVSTIEISYLSATTSTNRRKSGGARRDRTADLLRAKQALSQLSYGPLTCPFSVWPRWLLAHSVMYQHVHSLDRSQAALPNEKSPASAVLFSTARTLYPCFGENHFSEFKAKRRAA